MKKLLAITIGVVLLLSMSAKFSKPRAVPPAGIAAPASAPRPAEAAGSMERPQPADSGSQLPAARATPPPMTSVVEQALRDVPSPQELERIYSSYKSSELRVHLKKSQVFVARNQLIERANAEQLKPVEIRALATEIRRQDVIKYLLLSRHVARMKEKYL